MSHRLSSPADPPSHSLSLQDSKLSGDSWRRIQSEFGPHSADSALPSNAQVSMDGSPLPIFSPYPIAGSAGVNLFAQSPLYFRPSFLILTHFPLFPLSPKYTVSFGSHQFSSRLSVCLILLPVNFGGLALAHRRRFLSFFHRGAHKGRFSPYSGGFLSLMVFLTCDFPTQAKLCPI